MEGLLAHCVIVTNVFQMKERKERKESKKVKGKKKLKHCCIVIIMWKKKNRSKGKVGRRGERRVTSTKPILKPPYILPNF